MKTEIDPELKAQVAETAAILKNGGLVLYPTDTIWGIGCDATNEDAVRKVFELKKRADSKSLVLLASDLDMVAAYIEEVPEMAEQLVEVNDAPMTIIYPAAHVQGGAVRQNYALAPSCVAQDGSVGIRIPSSSEFCMALLRTFHRPIVSTSANISGEASPKSFSDISEAILNGVDHVVDRSCEGASTGKASQIIKLGLGGEIQIIRG